jgi:D-glycero-alpha-D-manno-heptose-7-phosphate kinase
MITSSAPIRLCDIGGWTDTWFGSPGRVLHIGCHPRVVVHIDTYDGPEPVLLRLDSFSESYAVLPSADRPLRHRLVEAAIDTFPPPKGMHLQISIKSGVPPGCGTGTSAAVAVALIGALSAVRGEQRSSRDIAYESFRLEVSVLGLQSGIQDQLCASFGGINFLRVDSFPDALVEQLPGWDELSHNLSLVFLGRAHDSSKVHGEVIERLGSLGGGPFAHLRQAAHAAHDAVMAHNLYAFGHAMIANTAAQKELHPDLVGSDATNLIESAKASGALGWKVNGAGGNGGSLTLLFDSLDAKEFFEANLSDRYRVVPICISDMGLVVEEV